MILDAITKRITLDNVALIVLPISVAVIIVRLANARRRPHTTRLKGPPSNSYLLGLSKELFTSPDLGIVYENWEKEYGPVFEVPAAMGSKVVVLCDPKAVAYHYSKDTFTYQQPPGTRFFIGHYFGHNLLWAEAEDHKRQRKALSSAFSASAIRRLTSVFFDSAYQLKANWDSSFQSSSKESLVIEVQQWMNNISLDSIGRGGFSYDFGALKGSKTPIAIAFDSFGDVKPSLSILLLFLLSPSFPILAKVPNKRNDLFKTLKAKVADIADDLLERTRKEKEANMAESAADKSIIGTLVRSENASSSVHMSHEEILAQMNLLILAGYETTAISLTWALIELSKKPEEQDKLRAELDQFSGEDPTYEQLTSALPFLDAVVCEILRLHPPVAETTRQAQEDDIIPLSNPVFDADDKLVDSIFVAKGTKIRVPIMCLNRSEVMWGKDAKEFIPGRWLNETLSQRATEIQGHRHLLTFVDGPRTCLGKPFALTEFKAVLSVLIRNFTFEFPNGPTTKIENHRSILARPKVAGQEGPKVPLLVRRVE